MNLAEIPLFQMLKGRLGYLGEQQKVIAENVANTSSAGYVAQDLKAFSFSSKVQAGGGVTAMAATSAGHLRPPNERRGLGATYKPVKTATSETTLNGNTVVLEEEMIKMGDARTNYDAAIGFYQKSLGLMRMAARRPGSG